MADDATVRCLSHDDSNDPSSGHESRMHRTAESEANLLGVVFTYTGVMTSAPYPCSDEKHWAMAGTGLRNGDLFGRRRCTNGSPAEPPVMRPTRSAPTLQRMFNVSQKGPTRRRRGGSGFRETGRGAVFSVGSITWVSALFIDPHVSRITRNVLERFLLKPN